MAVVCLEVSGFLKKITCRSTLWYLYASVYQRLIWRSVEEGEREFCIDGKQKCTALWTADIRGCRETHCTAWCLERIQMQNISKIPSCRFKDLSTLYHFTDNPDDALRWHVGLGGGVWRAGKKEVCHADVDKIDFVRRPEQRPRRLACIGSEWRSVSLQDSWMECGETNFDRGGGRTGSRGGRGAV